MRDESVETESYGKPSDSEISASENDCIQNLHHSQNFQDEQEKSVDTTIQERPAQNSSTNEEEMQLSSKCTHGNTRKKFQVPLKKLKIKQTGIGC